MKRIYLIDCPGIVQPSPNESQTDVVLKGVVRVENLTTPEDYIPALLSRVKSDYLKKTYKLKEWRDSEDFLTQIANASGRLMKGGEPDMSTVAKMVLNDWLRGKIPYYCVPPGAREENEEGEKVVTEDTEVV